MAVDRGLGLHPAASGKGEAYIRWHPACRMLESGKWKVWHGVTASTGVGPLNPPGVRMPCA